jgi:uncharacterized cofD-like protein
MAEAIKDSKAKKVYVCNLMTKHGETHDFSVSDFTKEIEKYLNHELDYVIYNIKKPEKQRLLKYKKENPKLIELVSYKEKTLPKGKFIGTDLLESSGPVVHDPDKLSKVILKLCKQ